jgi:hypothetical protein
MKTSNTRQATFEPLPASDLFGGELSLRLGKWVLHMDVDQRGPGRYYASLRMTHTSELVSAGGYCDTWQGPYGLNAAIRNAWWHGLGMAIGFGCLAGDLPLRCPFAAPEKTETQLALL